MTAVVLNYNGRALLDVILPSLAAQRYASLDMLVVDDCSTDDSLAWLAEHWPAVKVVSTERNVGVAGALNRGVAAAAGELVALLNNDLELEPDWVAELVDALDRHPEAGSAACKLLNFYRRDELDGAGDVFIPAGAGAKRGNGEPDDGRYDAEDEVLGPTGGAGMYRRSALEDVGGFDESFVAYFEDVDWSLRAQGRGYRCVYVPTAVGYHMEGRTTGGTANPRFYSLQWRNMVGTLVKNVPLRWVISHSPWIAEHYIMGLVRSTRRGMLKANLRGLALAVPASVGWLRARRRIASERRIGVREYTRALDSGRR